MGAHGVVAHLAPAITDAMEQGCLAELAAAGPQQLFEQQGLLGGEIQGPAMDENRGLAGLKPQGAPGEFALQGPIGAAQQSAQAGAQQLRIERFDHIVVSALL